MSERRITIDEKQPKEVVIDPITKHPNGLVEVKLSQPITATVKKRDGNTQTQEFASITFRSMSFGDVKAMANIDLGKNVGKKIGDVDLGEMDMAYWLVQRLSNVPAEVLDQIDGEDMQNCIEAIGDFFTTSQKTSKDELS
ncbi:MAG: phage tail assembly protein [Alphaproteobacteria bacterium]|jgi:hypothetical protein|nr:phage tail assembly protein [Alphaproteobacteria bacterium]